MSREGLSSNAVAELARRWIGTPYRHQCALRGHGADCLGLLRGIWREIHGSEPCSVPPYPEMWFECGGVHMLEDNLERLCGRRQQVEMTPGDILLFRVGSRGQARHLGILTEAGEAPSFVHAYSRHGVVESHLTKHWRQKLIACFVFP